MREIYNIINTFIDEYSAKGISDTELLSFLNKSKKNYDQFINSIIARIKTGSGKDIEQKKVEEYFNDIIRDRTAYEKDVKNNTKTGMQKLSEIKEAPVVKEHTLSDLIDIALSKITARSEDESRVTIEGFAETKNLITRLVEQHLHNYGSVNEGMIMGGVESQVPNNYYSVNSVSTGTFIPTRGTYKINHGNVFSLPVYKVNKDFDGLDAETKKALKDMADKSGGLLHVYKNNVDNTVSVYPALSHDYMYDTLTVDARAIQKI